MNKKAVSFVIMSLFLFANIGFSTSTYQAEVGNIFQFDVLVAEAYVKLGDTIYSGSGFDILGNTLQVPYTCTLIVDAATVTSVTSTFYGGGYSEPIYSYWTNNDEWHLRAYSIYPTAYGTALLLSPSSAADGFGPVFIPFVDRALVGTFFDEVADQTNTFLTDYLAIAGDPSFDAISTLEDNIRYFEVYFTGTAETFNYPTYEIDFKHQFRCAYEYDTGFLLGMHYKTEGKGIYEGEKAKYECESLVEKHGYDLPKAQLAGFDISEDWWIIAVSGGGLLLVIVIIVTVVSLKKKQKPKKKKKKSSKKKKK